MSTDLERLGTLSWFGEGESHKTVWNAVLGARELLQSRPHSTVYYPGALGDIPWPLALTDGTKFVFSDPAYEQPHGVESIRITLDALGFKPIVAKETNEIDGTYTTITFEFDDKPRTIQLYPFDAAQRTPSTLLEEMGGKPVDTLLLKNTYGVGVTSLDTSEAFKALASTVAPDGVVVSAYGTDPAQLGVGGFISIYDEKIGEQELFGKTVDHRISIFQRQ